MQLPSEEMVVDVVDESNKVIGRRKRKDLFSSEGGFRTVHVFLKDGSGKMVLQQQAKSRKRAPLTWGSTVAAYLFAGEGYIEAARRRVRQELGVDVADLNLVGVVKVDDLGHDKFVGLVEGTLTGKVELDRTQIAKLEALSIEEVRAEVAKAERAFSPLFLRLLEAYESNRAKR